jgi:hypothetical protein
VLTLISDKYVVRDYVANKIGPEHLIPMLLSGDKLDEIPFDRLPEKFVLKTNHGCGDNILVSNKNQANHREIKKKLKKWLSENYALDRHLGIEWGYKNIKPVIIVEKFIDDNGKPPVDYKFYCFSERVELITEHFDRYGERKDLCLNGDFERFCFGPNLNQCEIEHKKPSNFEAMLHLAEKLLEGSKFLRVDLYNLENKIYFGELTPYPAGVSLFRAFDIHIMDEPLGEKWSTNSEWV